MWTPNRSKQPYAGAGGLSPLPTHRPRGPAHLEIIDILPRESLAEMTRAVERESDETEAPAANGPSITQLCNDWASHNRRSNARRAELWHGVNAW